MEIIGYLSDSPWPEGEFITENRVRNWGKVGNDCIDSILITNQNKTILYYKNYKQNSLKT